MSVATVSNEEVAYLLTCPSMLLNMSKQFTVFYKASTDIESDTVAGHCSYTYLLVLVKSSFLFSVVRSCPVFMAAVSTTSESVVSLEATLYSGPSSWFVTSARALVDTCTMMSPFWNLASTRKDNTLV